MKVNQSYTLSTTSDEVIKLNTFLKEKKTEMVDLYNALYYALKEKIPGIKEHVTNAYIALRCDNLPVLAEAWIQNSQIRLNTYEPSKSQNKIGLPIPESYNWTKTYYIVLKRFTEVEKVVEALTDVHSSLTSLQDFVEDDDPKRREPNFRFSDMNIPIGATIHFCEDSSITCKVVDERRVEYKGEIFYLTGLASKLFGKKVFSGAQYFTYKGTMLWNIDERKDSE